MTYNLYFHPSHARADYNLRTGKYIPEWQKLARTTHKNIKLSDTDIPLTNYGAYSPAYVTTNEDWRLITDSLALGDKSVLTIAGSGDHPIAFATAGAKTVDTFDISFFAHVITDLKIAAIQTLTYQDYKKFVPSLRAATHADEIYALDRVATKCAPKTLNVIRQMDGCLIFKQGIGVYDKYMPTASEYAAAQATVTEPMDFIWSNVDHLAGHLTQKYDLIYLSTVFDFYRTPDAITKTLNALRPGLAADGCAAVYLSATTPAKQMTQLANAAAASELTPDASHKSADGMILVLRNTRSR